MAISPMNAEPELIGLDGQLYAEYAARELDFEPQYLHLLKLLKYLLVTRGASNNRTAVKTVKVPGYQIQHDLKLGLPLVTTKKIHLRSIIHEILWFLLGDTNIGYLKDNGVRIWNEWALQQDQTFPLNEGSRFAVFCKANNVTYGEAEAFMQDYLKEKGWEVNEENVNRFLDSHNLPTEGIWRAAGEVGPMYPHTWRHYPAGNYFKNLTTQQLDQYVNHMAPDQRTFLEKRCAEHGVSNSDRGVLVAALMELGIDQISQAVTLLKTTPSTRRVIVSAWLPSVVPFDGMTPQENVLNGRAALAACHELFQFITEELTLEERREIFWNDDAFYERTRFARDPEEYHYDDIGDIELENAGIPKYRLNCRFSMRSSDTFLGLPFNMASYAILTMMVAQVVNMVPGILTYQGGDVHLYASHLEAVRTQLSRDVRKPPKLKLNPNVKDLFAFTYEDFSLEGYDPHPAIPAPVAV